MPWPAFREYYQLTQKLEDALLQPHPRHLELQNLFSQLTTPQTSLAAWPELWAHLYPLLLIAQMRTG